MKIKAHKVAKSEWFQTQPKCPRPCETVQLHSRTVFSHPQRSVSYPPSTAPWCLHLWVSPSHTVCLAPCPKTSIPKGVIISVYWSTAEKHLSEEKVGCCWWWWKQRLGGEVLSGWAVNWLCSASPHCQICLVLTHKHTHTHTQRFSNRFSSWHSIPWRDDPALSLPASNI